MLMKRGIGVVLLAALFLAPACKKAATPLAERVSVSGSVSGDSVTLYVAGGIFVQDPVTGKQTLYAICDGVDDQYFLCDLYNAQRE
jgi:hypothetical protein